MTRTWSLLTHSIWKTIGPSGTCVNQSVKRQTHAHCKGHTKQRWHTRTHIGGSGHTHTHTKRGESELGSKRRSVFPLRHLLRPRDRWRTNQTAWCLCHSLPPLPPSRPSPQPAPWHGWQVAPCKCDTAIALENNVCIHDIKTKNMIKFNPPSLLFNA